MPTFISLDLKIEKQGPYFSKSNLKVNDYLIQYFSDDLEVLCIEIKNLKNVMAEEKFQKVLR